MADARDVFISYARSSEEEAHLDDPEGALAALPPYFENTSSTTEIRHLEVDPDLDSIRRDPRLIAMLASAKQRLGMVEAAE